MSTKPGQSQSHALEEARPAWRARVRWSLDAPPLRPVIQAPADADALCEAAAEGVAALLAQLSVSDVTDLRMPIHEARQALSERREAGSYDAALWSAFISDAVFDDQTRLTSPSPLLFRNVAQTNFTKNVRATASDSVPKRAGRRSDAFYPSSPTACLGQALLAQWSRLDQPSGFRWDPAEDRRYAYRAEAPEDSKPLTQHGANRLALVGVSMLTAIPVKERGRTVVAVPGGQAMRGFSLAWPIWRPAVDLETILDLLLHPSLRDVEAAHGLGVEQVRVARRISVGKFMNFTAAPPLGKPSS